MSVVRHEILHGLADEENAVVEELDGRVDLVRHTGRHTADGLQLLARGETLLRELALGDVEAHADDADDVAIDVAQRHLRSNHGARLAGHLVEAGLLQVDDRLA
jgi:hypothetical protein